MSRTSRTARPTTTWTSGPCRALEHHFELVVHGGPELSEALTPLVAPFRLPGAGTAPGPTATIYTVDASGSGPASLSRDRRRVADAHDAESMRPWLVWHLNRDVVAASSSRYVLLHAAAAQRRGVSVLLVADQECGKTTTVAGLLQAGFEYVTDEAVAVDPHDLTLVPFPKALTLDRGSWPLFADLVPATTADSWQASPEALGSRAVVGRARRPGVVVLPRYVAGAETRLVPLTRGEAVLELAQLTFGFADHPQRCLGTLGDLVAGARVTRLVIGDLAAAVRLVSRLTDDARGPV